MTGELDLATRDAAFEAQGRTLTMRGTVGEPARLVRLIAGTDAPLHRPALVSTGKG